MMGYILAILIGLCGLSAAFLTCLSSFRMIAVAQQTHYSRGGFLKWYYKKGNILHKRYLLLTLCNVLLACLFNVCFFFLGEVWGNFVSFLPFVGMLLLFIYAEKKVALKMPLRTTNRCLRLIMCYALLLAVVYIGLGFAFAELSFAVDQAWFYLFRFVPLALVTLASPLLLSLAMLVMQGYEIPHTKQYIAAAQDTLAKSSCKKIGITGSCGKTTVKHIAHALLSTKYSVKMTPMSYNTPVGIAKYINEEGADCEFFLIEMGAKRQGEIAELCDMISPDLGVITAINPQHMETFRSLENIVAEKSVLAARAKEGCAVGISAAEKGVSGTLCEGKDFSVSDEIFTADGCSFILTIGGESVRLSSCLLGKNAPHNIALAAALCKTCGMTMDEIAAAMPEVKQIPHRLEKIEKNGLTVLDDSYNANVDGAKDAVETLRLFGGKKVVVTPGIVELGELSEGENKKLGEYLVGLDQIVLVGETLVLPVRNGYLAAGGDESRLKVLPSLEKAQEFLAPLLSEGDTVLFLNDLPDCY